MRIIMDNGGLESGLISLNDQRAPNELVREYLKNKENELLEEDQSTTNASQSQSERPSTTNAKRGAAAKQDLKKAKETKVAETKT